MPVPTDHLCRLPTHTNLPGHQRSKSREKSVPDMGLKPTTSWNALPSEPAGHLVVSLLNINYYTHPPFMFLEPGCVSTEIFDWVFLYQLVGKVGGTKNEMEVQGF